MEEGGIAAGDEGIVFKLNGGAAVNALKALAGGRGAGRGLTGGGDDGTGFGFEAELFHQSLDTADGFAGADAECVFACGSEVAADDFLAGGVADDLVVGDGEAGAVDSHIRGGAVDLLAHEAAEDSLENGEKGDVPVVVNGGLAIGFEVEGIDEVRIAEVGGCGFVCEVDGVLEGDIPDGEGFEFRITGSDAATMFVVELGETGGHFSAVWAGGNDRDEGAVGFNEWVGAESLVAQNEVHIGGEAGGCRMGDYADSKPLQFIPKSDGGRKGGLEPGEHDGGDLETAGAQIVHQHQGVGVISDSEVGP